MVETGCQVGFVLLFLNCSQRPKLRVKATKDPMFSGQKSPCSGASSSLGLRKRTVSHQTPRGLPVQPARVPNSVGRSLEGRGAGEEGFCGWAELMIRGSSPAPWLGDCQRFPGSLSFCVRARMLACSKAGMMLAKQQIQSHL